MFYRLYEYIKNYLLGYPLDATSLYPSEKGIIRLNPILMINRDSFKNEFEYNRYINTMNKILTTKNEEV